VEGTAGKGGALTVETGSRLTVPLHATQVCRTPALSTEPADNLQELQRGNR
jgi:hypothetical protein